jgi:RNA polymerase sigma-70 factor (ECF subfamily)
LLDTTVASVNSALQRARATMAERDDAEPVKPLDDAQRDLLARYLTAFEQYDLEALTTLLRQDAIMSMPPLPLWLSGRTEILGWLRGPGAECQGSRLIPAHANGSAAFGQYRPSPAGGHAPWALQIIETNGDSITAWHSFLDTQRLFPLFGLPARLD